jgi:CspA family cold shock protein
MSSSDTSASVRLTGRVKWFNNKTGFGFITIVGGNDEFKDASEIFAHHSAIKVSQEQYRYLVEGEYVEFSVSNTAAGDHKFQAADIRGVKGGKLFCETRYEQRAANSGSGSGSGHAQSHGSGERSARDGERPVRGRQTTRGGSRGGRGEWMLVRKDSSEYRGGSTRGGGAGAGAGGGGRGRGGRVYSTRPSDESYVEHSQPQANAVSESAPVVASTSSNASATTTQSSDVPATPRAASTRKPRQSKPSS